jgi:hypothetical protein
MAFDGSRIIFVLAGNLANLVLAHFLRINGFALIQRHQ